MDVPANVGESSSFQQDDAAGEPGFEQLEHPWQQLPVPETPVGVLDAPGVDDGPPPMSTSFNEELGRSYSALEFYSDSIENPSETSLDDSFSSSDSYFGYSPLDSEEPSVTNKEVVDLFEGFDEDVENVEDVVDEEKQIRQELSAWAVECKVPRSHVTNLLKKMRVFSRLSFLPADSRTLLKTPRSVSLRDIYPGKYYHFGLESGIVNSLRSITDDNIPHILEIFIHIDGQPIASSSRKQFWPILGKVSNVKGADVFMIGNFEGMTKPTNLHKYFD